MKQNKGRESFLLLHREGFQFSSLAQSVEHAAVNRSVVGSSPTGGVYGMRRGPRSGKSPDARSKGGTHEVGGFLMTYAPRIGEADL